MRFEKVEQCNEQGRVGGSLAQVVSPDSGQVEEPPGPRRFIERCGEGS